MSRYKHLEGRTDVSSHAELHNVLQGIMASISFKRPCLQAGIHVAHGSSLSVVSTHLSRLPLEMLAEILSYTSSPDILSLARTSRFFCATLVTNPASLFIWKAARRRFHPRPIPDPAPNWTESAYIAFLFDTAACEVCLVDIRNYGDTNAGLRSVIGQLGGLHFRMRCALVSATL